MSAKDVLRRVWNLVNYDEIAMVSTTLIDTISSHGAARTLVDVGAHTGTSARPFLAAGWTVYAFEPDDTNRSKLATITSDRLTIFPTAVSNEVTEGRSFYTSDVSSGISTLSSFHDSHEETQTVSTTTLKAFFEEYSLNRIGVLKIDVEGHELAVLEGMDWAVKPSVVVCEFDETKQTDEPPSAKRIVAELVEAGMVVAVSEWEPVVEYGRYHKPLRIIDTSEVASDAWGNVVGFSSVELRDVYVQAAQHRIRRMRMLHPVLGFATKVRRRLSDRNKNGNS